MFLTNTQMDNKITLGKSFSLGFRIFGKSVGWQILYMLIFVIIAVLGVMILGLSMGSLGDIMGMGGTVLFMLVFYLLLFPLVYGFAFISDQAYFGQRIDLGGAFAGFKKMFPLFGLMLISMIVSYAVMGIFGYVFLGDSFVELISLYGELISAQTSGDFNAMTNIQQEFGYAAMNNIGGLIATGLVSWCVQIFFLFGPYYLLFTDKSFGSSLGAAVQGGLKNFFPIFLVLTTTVIMAIIGIMILGLLTIFAAGIGAVLGYFFLIPLMFSMLQAMFRQLEPGEAESNNPDLEDILDME